MAIAKIAGPRKVARQQVSADLGRRAHEQARSSSSTEHALNLLMGSLASLARVGGRGGGKFKGTFQNLNQYETVPVSLFNVRSLSLL